MITREERIYQFIITAILTVICVFVLVPFLLVLGVSFSNELDIMEHGYSILPRNFDLTAYEYVFTSAGSVLNAYKVTIIFSVASMVLGVLLMSMLAFVLSKKHLKGKKAMSFYVYFTMLFSGGLVPSYILITQYLHLGNTIWVYILVGLISPWYVFMLRTFFQGIPYEITEAAIVDGASEFKIFSSLILPMSKPAIATIALFMFLGKWNDWNTALLYINDESLVSLQYLLQRIMQNIQMMAEHPELASRFEGNIPAETVRMAMAVVVAGPALLVFPFFQKYFVKGISVGAVKG